MQPILSHVQTSVLTEKKWHCNIQNIHEISVKVTKQAMKMCHLYYRFCSTDLGTTEVQVHFWVETGMLLFFKFLRFIVDFKRF